MRIANPPSRARGPPDKRERPGVNPTRFSMLRVRFPAVSTESLRRVDDRGIITGRGGKGSPSPAQFQHSPLEYAKTKPCKSLSGLRSSSSPEEQRLSGCVISLDGLLQEAVEERPS